MIMTDLVPKPFDEEHWIPIIDCPCGQKNTPVSMYGPLVKTIMGDEVEIVRDYILDARQGVDKECDCG